MFTPMREQCARLAFAGALFIHSIGCQHAEHFAQRHAEPTTFLASQMPSKAARKDARRDIEFSMARSLEAEGKSQKAIQAYRKVADAYEMPEAYHRLAVLHDLREDFTSSAKYYQQALRLDPNNPQVLCDLGYSYYLQQRLSESEGILRQAVHVAPADPLPRNNLGLVLGAAGRFDEAYEQFAAVSATKAEAHVNLSYTMLRSRRFDEAKEQLQLALHDDPNLPAARSLLASLPREKNSDAAKQRASFETAALLDQQRGSNVRRAALNSSASSSAMQAEQRAEIEPAKAPSATSSPIRLPHVPQETMLRPISKQQIDKKVRTASATSSASSPGQPPARESASSMSIIRPKTSVSDHRPETATRDLAAASVVAEEYVTPPGRAHAADGRASTDLYPSLNEMSGGKSAEPHQFDPFE